MISVIIVNYKVPFLLEKCIKALQNSVVSDEIEIIIVDNASNDESYSLINKNFNEIIWIQNSRNMGFAQAVNTGINKAQGEIIVLLNPDTEIFPGSLEACKEFFASHTECGIIGGKVVNPDGSVQPQCRRRIPKPGAAFFRLFGLTRIFPHYRLSAEYELPLEQNDSVHEIEAVSGALLCIRKDVLDKVGNMDGNFFLYGEDLDLCCRVSRAGYRIYYVPSVTAVHFRGASRKKRPYKTLWHIHQAMIRFYFKHEAANRSWILSSLIVSAIWVRWGFMIILEIGRKIPLRRRINQ